MSIQDVTWDAILESGPHPMAGIDPAVFEASTRLVSDFTVRIYKTFDGHRLEVIGNRTGKRASVPCTEGLAWVFSLIRALKEVGAYDHAATGGENV